MRSFLIGILVLLYCTPTSGQSIRLLGVFEDAKLQVDTQIESPPTYNGSSTTPLLRAGETLQVQLFVPDAAGKQTFGYNLIFDNIARFTDRFDLPTGIDWTGAPLTQTAGEPTLTALLISLPIVPANGYLGTVTLQARQNIEEGFVLNFKEATMADPSRDNDFLDLSEAALIFTNQSGIEGLKGDFDLDGDVDFSDFLTFANNFGKTGPIPVVGSSGTVTRTLVIRDTIFATVHDTITIVVRDTVYITANQPTDTSPATPGETYRNSALGYAFTIPQGWDRPVEDPQDRAFVTLERSLEAIIAVTATPNPLGLPIGLLGDAFIELLEAGFVQGGGMTQYRRVSFTDQTLGSLPSKEIVFTGFVSGISIRGQIVLATDSNFLYILAYTPVSSRNYDLYVSDFDLVKSTFQPASSTKVTTKPVPAVGTKDLGKRLGRAFRNGQ